MRIVVKHVDNLKSSLIKEGPSLKGKIIPQYLVYKMTDDDIAINCEMASGEFEMKKAVNKFQSKGEEFTLPVIEVSFKEYKNNVLRNEANYVGN